LPVLQVPFGFAFQLYRVVSSTFGLRFRFSYKFPIGILKKIVLVYKDFTWKIIAESPLPIMKGYFEQAFVALGCTSGGIQGGISVSEIYDKTSLFVQLGKDLLMI